MLFHGSKSKIHEFIRPNPSVLINNEEVVFATDNYSCALVFIPKWNDKDFYFGRVNNEKFYIAERYKGAFDILKTDGYVYTVKKDKFNKDNRLGMRNNEFISSSKVPIEKMHRVEDVYEELKKCIDITLCNYGT